MDIFDGQNPAHPIKIANIPHLGDVKAIHVSGLFSYIADQLQGMVIFDVTHPAAPNPGESGNLFMPHVEETIKKNF